MKRLLFIICALLFVSAGAFAQSASAVHQKTAQDTTGHAIPKALIKVCALSDSACSVASTIYSDNVNTVKANPFTADVTGNYEFWAAAGDYTVQVSKAGFATYSYHTSVGPSLSGNNAFTGNNTHSGTETFNSGICNKTWNYDVKACYGATGSDLLDDGTAIQNAVDDCETNFVSTGKRVPLVFPAGTYRYSAQLTKKSCPWTGTTEDHSLLKWAGAAGAVAVLQPSSISASTGYIRNLGFTYSTNQPATYLQIDSMVDQTFHVDHLHFNGATSDALLLSHSWVNAHFEHLRFDVVGGCWIRSVALASDAQSGSSWSILHFSGDNTGGGSNCMFGFQNDGSLASPSDVSISDGRIEGGTGAYVANSGIVRLMNSTGAAVGDFPTKLSEITGQVTGLTHMVYSEATAGTALPTYTLDGVKLTGSLTEVGSAAGSVWNGATGFAKPTGTNFSSSDSSGAPWRLANRSVEEIGSATSSEIFSGRVASEAFKRHTVNADGTNKWGNGTSATDVDWKRFGVNIVGTTNKIHVGQGVDAAAGMQAKRTVTTCATAASVGATCTSTVTWVTTFADTSYTASCTGNGVTSGVPMVGGLTAKTATSITFQTVAATAAAAQYTNIECLAWHD